MKGFRIAEKFLSATLILLYTALVLIRDWPNIGRLLQVCHYELTTNCLSELSALKPFESYMVVISLVFLGVSLSVSKSFVRNNENLERLNDLYADLAKLYAELKIAKASSIKVLSAEEAADFYSQVLGEIEDQHRNVVIRATSCFTPAGVERESYFEKLSEIITKPHGPHYRVLLAKGRDGEWDEKFVEEMKIRIRYLNKACKTQGHPQWGRDDFRPRRTRHHAKMDFFVVNDSVFINISTSHQKEGERGFVYIRDGNAARHFENWFDAIFDNDGPSSALTPEEEALCGYPPLRSTRELRKVSHPPS